MPKTLGNPPLSPVELSNLLAGWRGRGVKFWMDGVHLKLDRKSLTKAERAVLNANWAALKAIVASESTPIVLDTPRIVLPPQCEFCHQRPCVGKQHHAFRTLHYSDPIEVERRRDEASAIMLKMARYGHWSLD